MDTTSAVRPNPAQEAALIALCARYQTAYSPDHFRPAFDLPAGWVAGWVRGEHSSLYVGCDPEGRISS